MHQQTRILAIDYSRALAITLVVVGHWQLESQPEWWNHIIDFIYTFHMPLFLAMSGYLYMHTKHKQSYTSFLWKKAMRLLVPYFTTSVIIITLKLISQSHGAYLPNPVTPLSYLKILYLPEAGYFLWFVWTLWWIFVILPWFKKRVARTILFAVTALLTVIPFNTPDMFCLQQTKQMFVFFMVGVMLYDWKQYISIRNNYVALLSTALFATIYWLKLIGWGWLDWMLPFLGVFMVLSVISLAEKHIPTRTSSVLLTLSSASYTIYLFHTTFEGFVKSFVVNHALTTTEPSFVFSTLAAITAGIVCPTILQCYILNRWKLTSFLFGIKYHQTHRQALS
jgi:putative acyltransferase 3